MKTETGKSKTIVFVEDNPVVLTAYRNQMQREGFRVEPAQDGLEAMRILSKMVPDLVILDLLLPKFSGVDVLKFIHSQPRLKSVPVFILSTNSILDAADEPLLERAKKRLLKTSSTPAVVVQAVHNLFVASHSADGVPSADSVDSSPSNAKTVVFVEDNPVVLMAYRNRLEAGGFRIEPAQDGLEAMKILSKMVPDLVILDLLLPKFNGVDVLKYVQSNSRLKHVPTIILSTNSIIDAAEEYVLDHADKRLLKNSCTPAILLQTIRELLSGVSSAGQSGRPEATSVKAEDLVGTTWR